MTRIGSLFTGAGGLDITDAGLWGDDSQVVHLRDITHRYESTGNPLGRPSQYGRSTIGQT